ncbi:hypothetical protein CTRI78_v001478 [Colletotrichum trifolii]|uniref:Secreted protein n=1 Tax=Colletotrichum trifolii TaxID=5466 RepID=A0A4R8RZ17_COLTR|nr:hypothetical protein CTRI78_v001478 [Colletotrichum trifolii]
MFTVKNCITGLVLLSSSYLSAASPIIAAEDAPVLHDRVREPAPAGEPYAWIEYFTGDPESTDCVTLNPGAHLVLSNSTSHLEKRSGARTFTAYSSPGCSSGYIASTSGWGCVNPNCFNWGKGALSTKLTQEKKDKTYPTADLHNSAACGGSRQHHQGIDGTQSCDDANFYGSSGWQSAELWYNC